MLLCGHSEAGPTTTYNTPVPTTKILSTNNLYQSQLRQESKTHATTKSVEICKARSEA
jgi:hypothetical protein